MNIENIRKCTICHHLFQYSGYGRIVCPTCRAQDEEQFKKVKDYLRNNPGRTLIQTAEDCDVPQERIRAWLREERLEYTGTGETGLRCEHCGTPILSGTICETCRQQLNRVAGELRNSIEKPVETVVKKERDKEKMRFLH
jgi:DNA-directed RNA polymerase subunit RPC12/RpoP